MVVRTGRDCIRSDGLVEDSKTVAPQFETIIHPGDLRKYSRFGALIVVGSRLGWKRRSIPCRLRSESVC